LSCNGIGAVTAGLTLAAIPDRVRPRRLAFFGIGVFCIAVTAAGVVQGVLVFPPRRWCSFGFGLVTFFATSNATLQRRVPDAMRGRVMGLYSLLICRALPVRQSAGRVARALRQSAVRGSSSGLRVRAAAIVVVRLVPPAREPVSEPLAGPSRCPPPA